MKTKKIMEDLPGHADKVYMFIINSALCNTVQSGLCSLNIGLLYTRDILQIRRALFLASGRRMQQITPNKDPLQLFCNKTMLAISQDSC